MVGMFAAFITIGISPIAFSLGPLAVHWYGLGYVAVASPWPPGSLRPMPANAG